MKSIFLVPALLLALGLPVRAEVEAKDLYRPLTKAEFETWDAEYWQISKCQNDYFDADPDAYAKTKTFLASPGKYEAFLADAKLALGKATLTTLAHPEFTDAERVDLAIEGLAMQGMHPDRQPAENMRAFGVMRKYFAEAMVPNCQPSQEFQSKLRRMLDAKF